MNFYRDYFRILDKIRISKGISVSDLCYGIMSERTYYRYMLSNKDIRFEIYNKLLQKLEVDASNIIHYSFFAEKGDPGITRFIYRVHVKHFDDIEDIYHQVLKYTSESVQLETIIRIYVKKYEYTGGKISKESYLNALETALKKTIKYNENNINSAIVKSLYIETFPNCDKSIIESVCNFLVKNGLKSEPVFTVITFDNLLSASLRFNILSSELFIELKNLLGKIVQFFPHKYFVNRYTLYHCFALKNTKDESELGKHLYKYILGIVVLQGYKDFEKEINLVETLFDISAVEYTKKAISELYKRNELI